MSKLTKRIIISLLFIFVLQILCRAAEIMLREGGDISSVWLFTIVTIGPLVLGFSFYLSRIVKEHSKFWYNFLRCFIPFIVALNLIMYLLNVCFNFIV